MRALVQRVSQAAVDDARKGNRPSYVEAAPGDEALVEV